MRALSAPTPLRRSSLLLSSWLFAPSPLFAWTLAAALGEPLPLATHEKVGLSPLRLLSRKTMEYMSSDHLDSVVRARTNSPVLPVAAHRPESRR
jgi:hypothetical protein